MATTEFHLEASQRLLQQAERELRAGHSLHAAEQGWLAAARAVEAIAEDRGWEHDTTASLFTAANMIATETGQPRICHLFMMAQNMYQARLEGWIDHEQVTLRMDDVRELLALLKEVVLQEGRRVHAPSPCVNESVPRSKWAISFGPLRMVKLATTEFRVETSERLFRQARDELRAGDSLQASEKGWGAAAHAVKAIAESRGWEHVSHGDLFKVARNIATEMEQPRIRALFRSAGSLRTNFYEGWLDDEDVAQGLEEVSELLALL